MLSLEGKVHVHVKYLCEQHLCTIGSQVPHKLYGGMLAQFIPQNQCVHRCTNLLM